MNQKWKYNEYRPVSYYDDFFARSSKIQLDSHSTGISKRDPIEIVESPSNTGKFTFFDYESSNINSIQYDDAKFSVIRTMAPDFSPIDENFKITNRLRSRSKMQSNKLVTKYSSVLKQKLSLQAQNTADATCATGVSNTANAANSTHTTYAAHLPQFSANFNKMRTGAPYTNENTLKARSIIVHKDICDSSAIYMKMQFKDQIFINVKELKPASFWI